MRKYTTSNGVFYYPEENVNLIDTEELKIIVEHPTGYAVGDSVRLIYTFAPGNMEVGVNTFEMFSPLVISEGVRRAIFYIPLTAEFANDSISFSPGLKETAFSIKTKGSTDFSIATNTLNTNFSTIYLTNSDPNVRSNPIPVFFFSERGAGLFENKILNRQFRVADTNFSSVAIRQDKFNPFFMDVGGRNYALNTSTPRIKNSWTGASNQTLSLYVANVSPKWEVGKQVTIAFDVEVSDLAWSGGTAVLEVNAYGNVTDYDGFMYRRFFSSGSESSGSGQSFKTRVVYQKTLTAATLTNQRYTFFVRCDYITSGSLTIKNFALFYGNKAYDWAPAPEDYEVTEVVSGAELAEGMDKFNASYAFKLLDDSEWVTKKLVCPENYIQLFWGEPRSATRFSFWFEIKEIEKSSEAWGEVERDRELRAGTDVKERRKDVTKYRFPKTKLKLTSGVFRQDIIDQLKGIVHSPTIYRYNPYTKLNEERGVIAQITELRNINGIPTTQLGTGHFRLTDADNYSNIIEELINSPITSNFDLEFSVKGRLVYVGFLANRDDLSNPLFIASSITTADFTKYTFSGSIYFDRDKKVKPALWFIAPPGGATEIKDIYIKGYLGGIEDVEVEIATMNIIPHHDGESEMELTVISDDFRKPDYLYF